MGNTLSYEMMDLKTKCLGSLLFFTQTFFKARTGVDYTISRPIGREAHQITIARALTKVFNQETSRLVINIPPRYGKSALAIHFMAWCFAHYPDCQFLYISYGKELARDSTIICREIMQLPEYRKLFDVHIDSNFCAGDDFRTTAGGRVVAGGSDGTITGRGGGLAGVNRFGGCLLLDDMHKANSVSSDVQRNNVIDTYYSTIQSRGNQGWDTPQVMIGQRVHEADICDVFLTDPTWDRVIIRAIDDAGNALDPAKHTVDQLKDMEVKRPYEYYSQYQQNPQPSGGGIFKPEWFPILEHEPDIISTFITADTAETANTARDATVFSFWGLYKIIQSYSELNIYALHWLDCTEFWCEPKDLQSEFLAFYASCMRHRVKPQFAAIEKKSTGTTLVSTLNEIQGMRIIPVEHNSNSGSKITRFLNVQPFVASKLVSLPFGARHTKMCLDHVSKITAEDSARRDDITDTLQIAIQIALIDKTIINLSGVCNQKEQNNTAKMLMSKYNKMRQLRQQAFSK